MSIPITTLVQRRKSNKFPVNQEVTKNADGTGGPVSIAKQTEVYSKVTLQSNNKNKNVAYNAERVVRDKNSTTIQRANENKVKTRSYRVNEDGTGTLAVGGSNNPRGRTRTINNPEKAQRKMDRVNKRADKIISKGDQDTSAFKKKDACYRKAKSKYDVFPSAYASGYIAKCRKKKGNIG